MHLLKNFNCSICQSIATTGKTLLEAVQHAAVLRLRPILITTGAMIFGLIPLIFSHDEGAESRRAIGMVLISGLGFGTLFTLFMLSTLYCSIKSFNLKNFKRKIGKSI